MLRGSLRRGSICSRGDGPGRADGAHEPGNDRLRPRARHRCAARAERDDAGAGARRALARGGGALPAQRPGLAHLRRRPHCGRAPRRRARLVGAGLAARHRAAHRHPVVALAGVLAARRPPGAVVGGRRQPRHDDRVRRPQPPALMSPILASEQLEAYIEAHTTPPAAHLAALAEETRANLSAPQMLTGTVEGRLLEALVWAAQPQLVLELGTYSDYSALAMAAALPPGGRIVTCELSDEHADFAQRHIDASPYADRIEVRRGAALESVAALEGPFDLVFID